MKNLNREEEVALSGICDEPSPQNVASKNPKHIINIPGTVQRISLRLKEAYPIEIPFFIEAESSDTGQEGTYFYGGRIGYGIIPEGPKGVKTTHAIMLPPHLKKFVRLKILPENNITINAVAETVGG